MRRLYIDSLCPLNLDELITLHPWCGITSYHQLKSASLSLFRPLLGVEQVKIKPGQIRELDPITGVGGPLLAFEPGASGYWVYRTNICICIF